MKLILDNHKIIRKYLLVSIILLTSIVLLSFLYHINLQTANSNNLKKLDLSTQTISYKEDYTDTLFNIEYKENNIILSLKEKVENDYTWEYSTDFESWNKAETNHITIENKSLNFILVHLINKKEEEENIYKIDVKTPAKQGIKIKYNIETETTNHVIATLTSNSNITITNNQGKKSYTFIKNGEFTFEYLDEEGNKGSITARVDWIKFKEPTIEYSQTSLTNNPVTATLTCDNDIKIINNNGKNSYTFKDNGEFTFEYLDEFGTKRDITATVSWIDKTPPLAKIIYDITEKTDDEVTATLTNFNENTIILNNDGLDTYTFKENGSFTFIFEDEAGNISELTAKVSWINKIKKPITDVPEETDKVTSDEINFSKDAKSRKTPLSTGDVTLKVPTYIIKEPLELEKEEMPIENNLKEYLGNKSTSFALSLKNSNKKVKSIEANMNLTIEIDPEKKFLGIYRLNNTTDIEEVYYKKNNDHEIELEVSSLGQYILSYSKQNTPIKKLKKTHSDLEIISLFTLSIAIISSGIISFKKTRV